MDPKAKKVIIGVIIAFAVIIVVSLTLFINNQSNTKNKDGEVSISNLSSCSKNMQQAIQESMRTNMYKTIKAANDYNKKDTQPTYTSTLRDGSCTEKDIPSLEGTSTMKESTAILDIPDAKQSWAITYHWFPDGKKIEGDLGTVVIPKCLPADKLIYGDFNCDKIMSLMKYGTDKPDPILQYMPYTGAGFNLAFDPNTKEVTATIELRPSEKDNQKLINNLKGQVEYWFSHRDLDITNYKVTYVNKVMDTDANGNGYYGD